MRITNAITKAFFKKIDFTNSHKGDCWNWTGTTRGNKWVKYGSLSYFSGGKRVLLTAHRLSYTLHFGPIPKGLMVLHRCDNPICVRPQHLKLGSHFDNTMDMLNHQRQCFGERNARAKLKDKDIQKIRKLKGLLNSRQVGIVFKVDRHTIRRIWCGMSWSKVK